MSEQWIIRHEQYMQDQEAREQLAETRQANSEADTERAMYEHELTTKYDARQKGTYRHKAPRFDDRDL